MQSLPLLLQRMVYFWWQRKTRGWDDSETWNLNITISRFIIPRLRRLLELNDCFVCEPEMTAGEWKVILEDMLYFHEMVVAIHEGMDPMLLDAERYNEGRTNFFAYYNSLWW